MNEEKKDKVRVAVVGTGHLGRWHAEKYAAIENVELIGVCDLDREKREAVAAATGAPVFADHRELIGKCDAVSIAVPTKAHHAVGKDFLEAGINVLLEKPLASTLEEGRELVDLAEAKGVVFQIGHIERFNSATFAAKRLLTEPRFIECHRLAKITERGIDVDVILDLMIHDIDVVLSLVDSPVVSIDAAGTPVVTPKIDIANARLRFENGCVANLTASRASFAPMRKFRIFQPDQYLSLDFGEGVLDFYERKDSGGDVISHSVEHERIELGKRDSLLEEIRHFTECVREGTVPAVTGRSGLEAMQLAFEIKKGIEAS